MTPTHILLVEDNPSDARLIEEYIRERAWPDLEDRHPSIDHVERLSAAVDAFTDEVDVVLLDLGLPDSSGLETLDAMVDTAVDVPVVVLTGLDDERVGMDAVEQGAQDYLVKDDLTPTLLRRTLQYAIERERKQRQLRQRNEELALLNQIVRHDIRKDVSIIMGWGDSLRDHVDEQGEQYIEHLLEAGDHIQDIALTVGQFLEVLDGSRDPELRPIDLGRALSTEVNKARSSHETVTITVSDKLSDGTRVLATELLSSVFRNLINNAITHNDSQEPTVTVGIEENAERVRVTVADDGPGVPDTQKTEIFGRGEMGLESPGSGIGLYLVDTLVEMYGGTVTVEDNEPRGSVFIVTLDRASAEPEMQS